MLRFKDQDLARLLGSSYDESAPETLNVLSIDSLAEQLSAGGTFSLIDGDGLRVALVLRIQLPDNENTPEQWAAWAAGDDRNLQAVIFRAEEDIDCFVILPLAQPLEEAKAQALAERLVEPFGGESYRTAPVLDATLTVEPGSEFAVTNGSGLQRVDVQKKREDDAWEAASGVGGRLQPKPRQSGDARARLNEDHAIVLVKGIARVLTEYEGGISLTDESDLHPRYANDLRSIVDSKKFEPISKLWIRWKGRRTYSGGLGFWPDPDGAPAESYNLWKGWALDADPSGNCGLFLAHLRDIVCRGDEHQFQWLLGWLAHMVQRPGEKPRSALILKGCKGAGKDTVGAYVARMLPRVAYLNTGDMKLIVGQFNGILANKLLLHLEEGFWSGDRGVDSRLKNLITAPSITVNEKFQIPYEVDSFHRLIVTSNEGRVVNATEGERRYFIAELDPKHAKDAPYFDALRAEMNGSGPAALMHLLRGFDLSGWRFQPPATKTLREHVLDGLKGVPAWWHAVLRGGTLPGHPTTFEETGDWWSGQQATSAQRLYADYCEWTHKRRFEGDPLNDGTFAREFRKAAGDCLTMTKRQQRDGVRDSAYKFAPLAQCRDAFALVHGVGEWD